MLPLVRTRDGLTLAFRHWPCSPARGTVLLVHGLGEHGGRYHRLAADLNRAGWQVAAHDHRGHGASPGARGALANNDDLLHDLAAVVDTLRAAHPGRLVLLGHSMGGLVAARFVAGGVAPGPRPPWHREVDALVLSSPALDAGLGWAKRLLLAVARRVAPDLAQGNGLSADWLSRDPATVAAYRADPLVHDRITARLAAFIVDGGEQVRALAPRWPLRTLLLQAGSDRCVAPAGSAAFAAAANGPGASGRVTAHAYPALFHEIFNEPERDEVVATLCAWLDTQLPR